MRRNVWIPDALWMRIQRAAAREGAQRGETVSAAEYIREAVEEWHLTPTLPAPPGRPHWTPHPRTRAREDAMTSTTVSIRLEGHAAIDFAEAHGLMLQKYTDPTEQAREELSVEEAREIAQEDPSLVYVDIAPDIRVLGLGDEDWTAEADGEEREGAADARRWERYGTVEVQIGDVTYDVGVAIGVPAALRATAEAAGGDTTRPAYLDAWYVDASDWSCAPASQGPEGVPRELADAVLEAIHDARVRLWREYEEGRAAAAESE